MLSMPQKRLKQKVNLTKCVHRNNYPLILLKIFHKLLSFYGPRKWWPAKTRFEVIVGAILTQNVSWSNAKIAVIRLKKTGYLTPQAILKASHKQIAPLIKTSRFYNQKTEKLKVFCHYLIDKYGGSLDRMFSQDTDILRQDLLSLKGIGKETADSILLYAGNKLSFVVDAYTKRFLERFGILNSQVTYDEIKKFFTDNLPKNIYTYNEYHALIVHHCYAICKAVPICQKCPIKKFKEKFYCKTA